MFELTAEEADSVRCQFGTLQTGLHFRYSPYAFTEQGVAMLSSVLQSPRAVLVNIAVMRAFVRLRETLSLHKELAHKLAELERRIESHDASIQTLFEAIRQLMAPPTRPRGNRSDSMPAKSLRRTGCAESEDEHDSRTTPGSAR